MVLIYQVLTRQCLKKVFLTSNDFVPNDSSLLNSNENLADKSFRINLHFQCLKRLHKHLLFVVNAFSKIRIGFRSHPNRHTK